MTDTTTTRYSFSTDEEIYFGDFATVDEALAEAFSGSDPPSAVWVGTNSLPRQPEKYWDANDWLEHVACQEEYSLDCAQDWDESTQEQRDELETEVRKVMAAWLDRHDLRPKFFVINDAKKHARPDTTRSHNAG